MLKDDRRLGDRSQRALAPRETEEVAAEVCINLPNFPRNAQGGKGRRQPDATAAAYLSVIEKMPKEAQAALELIPPNC